jgi:thiol:disulfide interchange protein DsbC
MTRAVLTGAAFLIMAAAQAGTSAERQITETLRALLPEIEITSIRPSVIPGVYEVVIGTDVLYATADGRYVFRGDLLDLKDRRNLSEEQRAGIRRSVIGKIAPQDMIEFTTGKPAHVMYVFTDTDCAYCRRLHQDVPYLNQHGIAVRYLAFPRGGAGSATYRKMESVWCAKDRQQALTDAKLGKQVEERSCDNPVAEQYRTGLLLGVRGTPAIILEDGQQLPGYVPPDDIMQMLKRAR